MLDVCLLGTSGMMPLPNRWLTSLYTRYNGDAFLIDSGEGTQIALKSSGFSAKAIKVICFTHYHADHISGLPGLLLSIANSDRTEPVTMIGPRGLEFIVRSLCVIASDIPFEINFIELDKPQMDISFGDFTIHAFKVNHNVTCYGYSFTLKRAGKFDVEAAKAQDIPLRLWSSLQKGMVMEYEGKTYTPDMVMGPERKGLKVTYCTDSRPTRGIVAAAKGSDLFVCEGMYGEKEKAADAKKKKHMTFYEAARLAEDAGVGELWLTHFSPSLVAPERFLKSTRKIFKNTKLGKDGKTRLLSFEEDEEQ